MSEKTLKEVGDEAAALYGSHKLTTDRMQNPGFTRHRRLDNSLKQNYRINTSEAADFAKDHVEQLHDVAVIEAHLGGVAINVKQPLEIGQKVEVRTLDQQ